MYISHQGQQAIHQEIVNDGLRRSALQQIVREREAETEGAARARGWNPGIVLTALVRSMRGVIARPG